MAPVPGMQDLMVLPRVASSAPSDVIEVAANLKDAMAKRQKIKQDKELEEEKKDGLNTDVKRKNLKKCDKKSKPKAKCKSTSAAKPGCVRASDDGSPVEVVVGKRVGVIYTESHNTAYRVDGDGKLVAKYKRVKWKGDQAAAFQACVQHIKTFKP